MTLQIGFLLFPGIQQLDLTGPYDVLGSLPDVKLHLVWKDLAPITSSTGLVFTPTITYADCPNLDVLCVPGGAGVGPLMEDPQTLDFLKAQAQTVRYMTSVCTGSLVLGAAGLLRGRRATTHWSAHDLLAGLGAGGHQALPVMQAVDQPHQHEEQQQREGGHPHPARPHPPPGGAHGFAAPGAPGRQRDAADEPEEQQIGPQDHRLKAHHSSLTRGSTKVYDRSVRISPTM